MLSGWETVFNSHSADSKQHRAHYYKLGHLLPVYPVSSILVDRQHHYFIDQVFQLSGLPEEHFKAYYEKFIHNLTAYVQVLPLDIHSPLCSFLNDSLLRGLQVLYGLTQEHHDATLTERYAIFTGATLLDISSLMTNYRIYTTSAELISFKEWLPLDRAMTELDDAEYYKIVPLSQSYRRIAKMVIPLLAQKIMPSEGLLWINRDLSVFAEWMDVLNDESGGGRRLCHVLQLYKHKHFGPIKQLPDIAFQQVESEHTRIAESLFEWLKEALEKGDVAINTSDAFIHMTAEGVLIQRNALRSFLEGYVTVGANIFAIFEQFGNLFGLVRLSGQDYRINQMFSDSHSFTSTLSAKHRSQQEAYLIDPALLFMKDKPVVSSHVQLYKAQQRQVNQLPPIVRKQLTPTAV